MISKVITKNKYLKSRKSIKSKFILYNLLINNEELGDEGVPIKRLFKKIGKPIKIPYKLLNDWLNDFQFKIVNIKGMITKTMDDCLNRIEIPIKIEI